MQRSAIILLRIVAKSFRRFPNMKSKSPIKVKVGNAIVKIYRDTYEKNGADYERYSIAYYSDGKRKIETRAGEGEARARALELATQIAHGRINVLSLTNADRDSYLAALNLLQPLGVPLHAAVEEYVAARQALNGESLLSAAKEHAARRCNVIDRKVKEVVSELISAKQSDGLSVRYIQTLRSHLNRFASAFQTNIGSITSRFISDWLNGQGIGPRARNNLRMSIVTMFHWARAQGYLPKGQPTEADDVARAKDRGGKIEIFRPKQMASIMKSAPPEYALYFALGGFAGLRRAEIERLEWQDFNFERGHITVAAHKAKTATRRLVPIQPNLMQWLAPYRARRGPLFKSRRGTDAAIAFAKEQGTDWPDNALRHSYATYRLAAVSDTARVALEMGNSPQKLMTNYRELADDHDAAAWFAISPKRSKKIVQFSGGESCAYISR
jgi:integrase